MSCVKHGIFCRLARKGIWKEGRKERKKGWRAFNITSSSSSSSSIPHLRFQKSSLTTSIPIFFQAKVSVTLLPDNYPTDTFKLEDHISKFKGEGAEEREKKKGQEEEKREERVRNEKRRQWICIDKRRPFLVKAVRNPPNNFLCLHKFLMYISNFSDTFISNWWKNCKCLKMQQ